MSNAETFSTVVDLIYEAAFDDKLWHGVVKAVGEASGGWGGALTMWDVKRRHPPVSYNQGYPPDFWDDYAHELIHIDPLAKAIIARPQLDIYTDKMVLGSDSHRDKIRRHIMKRSGQDYAYGARVFSSNGIETSLILSRSNQQGPAGQDDIDRLQLFLPHIRRSIEISHKLAGRISTATLDAMSFAVVVLDEYGQVAFSNAAMATIAAERDGLRLSSTGLVLDDQKADSIYRQQIENLRRKTFFDARTSRTALPVARPSGKRPYSILICPYPRLTTLFPGYQQSILICVSDPAQTSHLSEEVLTALFGLTPAEGRLAINLISLGSLSAAAVECSLTEGSARQYAKQIFGKTGTHSQVELVALIMGSTRP